MEGKNRLFQVELSQNKEDEINSKLASLFYKAHRIGEAKLAVFSAYLMSKISSNFLTLLRFQQITGEDGHPAFTHLIFPQVLSAMTHYKNIGDHFIWQTSYLIASIPKWYMDEIAHFPLNSFIDGEELEKIRLELYGKYTTKEKALEFLENFEFPSWIYDEHVKTSKLNKNTILSGMPYNRMKIRKRWIEFYKNIKGEGLTPREIIRKWAESFQK